MATCVNGWVIYFDVIAISLISDNINHYLNRPSGWKYNPDSLFLNLIAAATSGYILYWLPIQTTYYVLSYSIEGLFACVAGRKFLLIYSV